MATSTTLQAIRDNWVSRILALTPTNAVDLPFDQAPRNELIRTWAIASPGSSFRRFQIWHTGGIELPGIPDLDESTNYTTTELTITVAYPRQALALYGNDDLFDMQDLIREDARKIASDLFFHPITGQSMVAINAQPLDTADDDVWFLDLVITTHFRESLT